MNAPINLASSSKGACSWGMNPSNPYFYTTISDGHVHPCDTPDIDPQEFFLAIMRDQTIPQVIRVYAMDKVMEYFPEWRPTKADYIMACHMMSLLKMEGLAVQ
jgi:hypothetical protein